jgi:hypothetical protein
MNRHCDTFTFSMSCRERAPPRGPEQDSKVTFVKTKEFDVALFLTDWLKVRAPAEPVATSEVLTRFLKIESCTLSCLMFCRVTPDIVFFSRV